MRKSGRCVIETAGHCRLLVHKSLLFVKVPPVNPALTMTDPAMFNLKSGQVPVELIIKDLSAL